MRTHDGSVEFPSPRGFSRASSRFVTTQARWIASFAASLFVLVTAASATAGPPTMVRTPPVYPACAATAIASACDPTATACAPAPSATANLIVDGTGVGGPRAVVLGGTARYASVTVRNCGRLYVRPFNGSAATSGVLRLIAETVSVDATSAIVGDGAGYRPNLCRDGDGPALATMPATTAGDPTGGRGGCRVADSAGGGGHYGVGGRGTTDCPGTCVFPNNWEQACIGALPGYSTPTVEVMPAACPATTSCRTGSGTLTNAGPAYFHNIYTLELGSAGGDAGCRDGDGFEAVHYSATRGYGVGGFGGGSLAIVGLRADGSGSVNIQGYVVARGGRGCAWDNDSGGGGAGGTILIVGDTVSVGATAVVSAEGGPGGSGVSTGGGNAWWNACGASNSSICDDCGGGGGGGIINVQSRSATLSPLAFFLANGGPGGGNFDGCTVCQGEAGGGAGEIQLDGAYVGEVCDGFDNDFNGTVDDGLGMATCGLGTCATSGPSCTNGVPPSCTPAVSGDPSCTASRGTARPRVAVILDSSGSMLWSLGGTPTFGDGTTEHPGVDLNGDTRANDSRIYAAKDALGQLISAYPEIDFALARYHQDEGPQRSCQSAKWFECATNCCSFDDPRNGIATSPVACQVHLPRIGAAGTIDLTVHDDAPAANRCINYAGTCGSPRRGADILVGFEHDVREYVSWLDGHETNFVNDVTPGAFCGGLAGDCEIRPTGPTPLAGSLEAVYDYVHPIQLEDPAAACRGYSVILISDGGEDCGGTPANAATALRTAGINTYVIGVSVNAAEGATLNAIASAGGTGSFIPVNAADQLLPALVSIVSGSIRHEVCNGRDDNCNGIVDEGFNVGTPCDNAMAGACRGTGMTVCDPSNVDRTVCQLTMPGAAASAETCNGLDDNCDGRVDEGDPGGGAACGSTTGACRAGMLHCQGGMLVCIGATSGSPEVCNGIDDDCDGQTDEGVPVGGPCGSSVGECRPGMFECQGALGYVCVGGSTGTAETCDGLDNDCNGMVDDNVPGTGVACTADASGTAYCHPGVVRCLAGALRCQGAVPFHPATCTCTPDECAVADTDGGAGACPAQSACIACACRTPCRDGEFPCSIGLECRDGFCVPPTCGGRFCTDDEVCSNDQCVDRCATINCPSGQACTRGRCVENNCYGLGCAAGQVCLGAQCVSDPCASVHCASDAFCRDGACVTTCEGVGCPSGQSCRGGACVNDPCAGITCPSGEVCTASAVGSLDGGVSDAGAIGRCVHDPCINVGCGPNRTCRDGACVDDPCARVQCPGDPSQVVCRAGECLSRMPVSPPSGRERVVATGGCAVSPGRTPDRSAHGLGALAFAVAALAIRSRRVRRGAR